MFKLFNPAILQIHPTEILIQGHKKNLIIFSAILFEILKKLETVQMFITWKAAT